MNYILQINAFRKLCRNIKLSSIHIALYYELLGVANDNFWIPQFRISNNEIRSRCHEITTDSHLQNLRRRLINLDLIRVEKGTRGKEPQYTIVKLYYDSESKDMTEYSYSEEKEACTGIKAEKPSISNDVENDNTDIVELNKSNSKSNINTFQSQTKEKPQFLPINIKTNTKTKTSNGGNSNLLKVADIFNHYEDATGRMLTSMVASDIESFVNDGMEPQLIIFLIDYGVANSSGNGKWAYIRTCIENNLAEGIKTVEDYKKNDEQRRQSISSERSSNNSQNTEIYTTNTLEKLKKEREQYGNSVANPL